MAAARLLDLDARRTGHALRLALLGTSGLRAAFGSHGKALQVGAAAATGARAARLAAAGATAGTEVERGWEEAYGARWVEPEPVGDAIRDNWIKAYPCCLQTHGAIDAALASGASPDGDVEIAVHPVSLTAAEIEDPADGLQAKFSIPYLTAHALMRGAPTVESFDAVDDEVRAAARTIRVRTDPGLLESEAILTANGTATRVEAAVGSPLNPMTADRLRAKIRALAGHSLEGALDDPKRPAAELARILPAGGNHP
jgi:2-methylcitrate dehydratase PrpD